MNARMAGMTAALLALTLQTNERVAARGHDSPGPIRVFANAATGTCTMHAMQPNGMACIAGAGGNFILVRKAGRNA